MNVPESLPVGELFGLAGAATLAHSLLHVPVMLLTCYAAGALTATIPGVRRTRRRAPEHSIPAAAHYARRWPDAEASVEMLKIVA